MNPLAHELQQLHHLKDVAEEDGRTKKDADALFKEQQTKCLELMEGQECESFRTGGVLFTRCEDRVKGQVEDRRLYIRWCLEQDEGVQEWLDAMLDQISTVDYDPEAASELVSSFYELLVGGLEMVAVKEKQDRCNAQARAHIDDKRPMPPGLTYRPDPYIAQRRS